MESKKCFALQQVLNARLKLVMFSQLIFAVFFFKHECRDRLNDAKL